MRHSRQDGVKVARAYEDNVLHSFSFSFFLFREISVFSTSDGKRRIIVVVVVVIVVESYCQFEENPRLYGDGFLLSVSCRTASGLLAWLVVVVGSCSLVVSYFGSEPPPEVALRGFFSLLSSPLSTLSIIIVCELPLP
jgi:hypothetical protein